MGMMSHKIQYYLLLGFHRDKYLGNAHTERKLDRFALIVCSLLFNVNSSQIF